LPRQEAAQLARAASEPLENVRRIALAAAKAWNVEATWAERREKGHASIPRLHLSGEEQHEDRMEQERAQSGPGANGDVEAS
jgi:hypothetical protein